MRAVTSYPNPDTDGVASMLGYCALVPGTVPIVLGDLNPETAFVLRHVGVACSFLASLEAADEIVLVDTHHPRQLPGGFPFDRVVEVIDHHPAGNSDAFPKARVQNEPVGAAATLISERCLGSATNALGPVEAAILGCGIASNTLDLRGPTTHRRDEAAAVALRRIAEPRFSMAVLTRGMAAARGAFLEGPTGEVIARDGKVFRTPAGDILIGQVEAAGAATVLGRADLLAEMESARARLKVGAMLLNLVDLDLGVSVLVSTTPVVWDVLYPVGLRRTSLHVAWADRLLLRKSDLVPMLVDPSTLGGV